MTPCYPDAYVKEGRIFDMLTHEELPSYTGLILADLAGRSAIMFTSLPQGVRDWELVHWGSTLSTTEIATYLKGKNNETI